MKKLLLKYNVEILVQYIAHVKQNHYLCIVINKQPKTWGQHGKFCNETMKYPDYRTAFSKAHWFGGHLCLADDGLYYKLVRVDGEKEKQLKSFTYDELDDKNKGIIEQTLKDERESTERLKFFFTVLKPARCKLIEYVKTNGRLESRSNQSESEYWSVKSPVNGMYYNVRISGHVYPTGSMTNLNLNIIDTTDYDCRQFLELFSLQ